MREGWKRLEGRKSSERCQVVWRATKKHMLRERGNLLHRSITCYATPRHVSIALSWFVDFSRGAYTSIPVRVGKEQRLIEVGMVRGGRAE